MIEWTDVHFTLNGEPVPIDSARWEPKPLDLDPALTSRFYEASCTVELQAGEFERLLEALKPKAPPGASIGTLAKRVFYGGRKGRRAFRRILARGYDGVAMTVAGPLLLPRGYLDVSAH